MLIDSNLTWRQQINNLSKKVNYSLKCLYPLGQLLDREKLKILCESLCLSHLHYMTIVWEFAKKKYLKPANKCLKTAGRFILGKKKRDNITNDITDTLQWLLPSNV